MSTNTESRPRMGVRIVALVMMIGGIVGVFGAIRLAGYFAKQQEFSRIVVPGCSMLLFAWTVRVGVGVWQAKAQFLRWAEVLFALQVVVFNVGGYAYELYTGISAKVMVGGFLEPMPAPSHTLAAGAKFGSTFDLNLAREDSRWLIGINLVALIIWIYLLRRSKLDRADPPIPAVAGREVQATARSEIRADTTS